VTKVGITELKNQLAESQAKVADLESALDEANGNTFHWLGKYNEAGHDLALTRLARDNAVERIAALEKEVEVLTFAGLEAETELALAKEAGAQACVTIQVLSTALAEKQAELAA
jgi:hypothetical protein